MATRPGIRRAAAEKARDDGDGDGERVRQDTVDDDKRMPFTEHLVELRTRLRNSVLGILAATIVTYIFRAPLFTLLAKPFVQAWLSMPKEGNLGRPEMVFTDLSDAFMVLLKVALLGGIFLASPVIFHQIWKFISPGLYARERRIALPFILVSVMLFVGGAVFAYIFVLPASYKYFLGYSTESMGIINEVFGKQIDIKLSDTFAMRPMITVDSYFSLTSMLLLVFGVVFELPLLLAVLALLGVVSPRGLWRFNRYAVLIFFVAGAILTPGDLVVGQIALGGALTVLYNLSILIAVLVGRKRKPVDEEPLSDQT
jgi:sec-independent protein translocase protein TatC